MSSFIRPSKYRHVYGSPHRDKYENIKVSLSAFDTNMAAVSSKYLSVNWQASGGGAFAVIPLSQHGKLPDIFPLVRGHTAPVLDTAWNPFDDSIVASAGEDGKVALAKIDDSLFEAALSGETEISDIEHVKGNRMGHGRKAGNLLWHPTADNVLASASYEVKIWDVSTMECKVEFEHQPDMVGSMSFDYSGVTLATTCRDKKLRLYDTRSGGAPAVMADSHTGVKGSRVCWMGDLDTLVTTGFSRMSDRQLFVWDSRKLVTPIKQVTVDTSAGTLMPFFSGGTSMLFLAGKGDGNVRYYEWVNDELHYLSEYKSSDPQRGMTFLPPRAVNVLECEIARAYKVTNNIVEPISFIVPRKSDSFQSDIYPPAPSGKPAQSASDFFNGKTASPALMNMEDQSQATSTPIRRSTLPAQATTSTPASATSSPITNRKATATSSAEPARAASTPIHPASSISEAGGVVPAQPSQSPTPISRSASLPQSAVITSSAAANGGSESSEVSVLKNQVESLKEELSERDHLIRKLELQLEQLRTNAKKAREALAI